MNDFEAGLMAVIYRLIDYIGATSEDGGEGLAASLEMSVEHMKDYPPVELLVMKMAAQRARWGNGDAAPAPRPTLTIVS